MTRTPWSGRKSHGALYSDILAESSWPSEGDLLWNLTLFGSSFLKQREFISWCHLLVQALDNALAESHRQPLGRGAQCRPGKRTPQHSRPRAAPFTLDLGWPGAANKMRQRHCCVACGAGVQVSSFVPAEACSGESQARCKMSERPGPLLCVGGVAQRGRPGHGLQPPSGCQAWEGSRCPGPPPCRAFR